MEYSRYVFAKVDGDVLDYYWATTDSKQIPRKLDEGGSRIKDFIMSSYHIEDIPENFFHVPEYCSGT